MMKIDGVEHAKKLWILGQVLETGSFRAAALRAKVSTPAISQALSSLERLVGKPLLIRKEGKISPTDTAEQLLKIAGPAIQALTELSLRTDAPDIAWISFGAYESLAIDLLPPLTHNLKIKLPDLKLTVRIANNSALATMVRNGELCAALVEENENLGRLHSVQVAEDRLGCFISANTPESEREWSTLLERPIGTISPGVDGYSRYYMKFAQTVFGKKFRPSLVSDSYEVLRSSSAHGAVMAILPTRIASRRPGELIEVFPPDFSNQRAGKHGILLISQPNCDPEEIRFLASEITPLLNCR